MLSCKELDVHTNSMTVITEFHSYFSFFFSRGNPLHLSAERYHKLERLWMDHSIPEEIAHSLEASPNLFNIDWQHL